jgi:hypothetical protein
MCPEQKAVEDWFDSYEGKSCSDPITLGCDAMQSSFLRNRLWKAFTAGLDAGAKIHRNQVIKILSDLLP